jgi:hypothetical protein
MAGSKFCLFHTPDQKMKRSKKKVVRTKSDRVGFDDKGRKKFWRRTSENQIAVRGSKALGAALVAKGTYLKNKPDSTVKITHHRARYNRQGTVMVGAHTQRTIEPTTSDRGRNFQQTDHLAKERKRKRSSRMIKSGRYIPVLGYGYMAYNVMGQPTRIEERRPGEGWAPADAYYIAEGLATEASIRYAEGASPLGVVDGALGGSQPGAFGMADLTDKVAKWVL